MTYTHCTTEVGGGLKAHIFNYRTVILKARFRPEVD